MKYYRIFLEDWPLHQSLLCDLIDLNQKYETGQSRTEDWAGENLIWYQLQEKKVWGKFNGREKIQNGLEIWCMQFSVCNLRRTPPQWPKQTPYGVYFVLCSVWDLPRDLTRSCWYERGTTIPKFDKVTTKAIQLMCNITCNQMRILQTCLQTELRSFIFDTQNKIYQIVNNEYVEPMTGIFKFEIEIIHCSYKVIGLFWCSGWICGKRDNQNNRKAYKQTDICINIDNGEGN